MQQNGMNTFSFFGSSLIQAVVVLSVVVNVVVNVVVHDVGAVAM